MYIKINWVNITSIFSKKSKLKDENASGVMGIVALNGDGKMNSISGRNRLHFANILAKVMHPTMGKYSGQTGLFDVDMTNSLEKNLNSNLLSSTLKIYFESISAVEGLHIYTNTPKCTHSHVYMNIYIHYEYLFLQLRLNLLRKSYIRMYFANDFKNTKIKLKIM